MTQARLALSAIIFACLFSSACTSARTVVIRFEDLKSDFYALEHSLDERTWTNVRGEERSISTARAASVANVTRVAALRGGMVEGRSSMAL